MSDLCVSCNLCCDGSIFARVPVTREEQARLLDGEEAYVYKGNYRMRQPCTYLGKGGACGCYNIRPEACRTYDCKLSKAVIADEIAEPDAIRTIQTIKAEREKATKLALKALSREVSDTSEARFSSVFRDLKAALKAGEGVNAFLARRAMMQRERYDALVRRHLQSDFRKRE